ncbi:MAG: hypothetical protein QOG77_3762 [Solirubrobacteraceae bacterium]|nr:hypothetical protein [Solirubrobacteraceae bacterium]
MTDDATLSTEVEQLRARNAALQRRLAWRGTARKASVVGLLILGCGLAALSVLAIWLRVTLLDTDRYVDTVAPIAAKPAVQKAVADKLDTAITTRIDFTTLAREVLPERADVLAPALANGAQSVIRSRLDDFTQSERFQTLWTEANRRAHARVVALLTGERSGRLLLEGDTVYLDLSPAVDRVRTALAERGLDRIAAAIPPTVDGQVALVQSDALVTAQGGVRLLKGVAILLPVLALLCLAGSVALSRPWRRGLLRAAIGIVVAMLILVAALGVARSAYLDALSQGTLPRQASADIFDSVVTLLRTGLRVVAVAAVLLAIATFLAGMPLGRVATSAWSRFATDSRTAWVAVHRRNLMLAIGAVGALVLLVASPLTGGVVLVVLLIVGGSCAAIAAVASQAGAVADRLRAEEQGARQ